MGGTAAILSYNQRYGIDSHIADGKPTPCLKGQNKVKLCHKNE